MITTRFCIMATRSIKKIANFTRTICLHKQEKDLFVSKLFNETSFITVSYAYLKKKKPLSFLRY